MDKPVLYVMVFIILFFGPCRMKDEHRYIMESLDRIEIQLGINDR